MEDPLSLTLNRANFQAMQRMLGPKLIAVGWLSFKTKFPLGCGAGRSYAARHLKAKGELQTAMEHYVWFSASQRAQREAVRLEVEAVEVEATKSSTADSKYGGFTWSYHVLPCFTN